MNYTTDRGRRFDFSGWGEGDSPLEHFDAERWIQCAHGVCLMLAFIGSADLPKLAVQDDGLLHELIHLALGIDICTHGSMDDLRAEVAHLQTVVGKVR